MQYLVCVARQQEGRDTSEYERVLAELVAAFCGGTKYRGRPKGRLIFPASSTRRLVELLVVIEQKFAVQSLVEDFQFENFRSIEKIASLVLQHMNSSKVS